MSSHYWVKFVTALDSRGLSFDQVRLCGDRRSVINAAGFTDALDVAVIETEWARRVAPQLAATGHSSAASSGHASHKQSQQQQQHPQHAPSAAAAMSAATSIAVSTAVRPNDLRALPEEVQDAVIAEELLHALMGAGGELIIDRGGGDFGVTDGIPAAMRHTVTRALSVANAYVHLTHLSKAESQERLGLVSTALGEVIGDITVSYLQQIGRLHEWSRTHPMPLVKVAAEVQRVGYPVERVSKLIASIAAQTGGGEFPTGGILLQELHEHLTRSSGNAEDDRLLTLVLRRASAPYLAILRRWITEGVLDDAFQEFFVEETDPPVSTVTPTAAAAAAAAASGDGRSGKPTTWGRTFIVVKSRVPKFLTSVANSVYHAGRYRCILRDLGVETTATPSRAAGGVTTTTTTTTTAAHSGAVAPAAEPLAWGDFDALAHSIHDAHDSVCAAMAAVLFDPQRDLLGHMESLKRYFLQERGDWLVVFLDDAGAALRKSSSQVKAHTVKMLLRSAIAKTNSGDPYHGKYGCSFDHLVLTDRLSKLQADAEASRPSAKVDTGRCIDLLQLDFEVEWPLSQVINRTFVAQMNCVFRLLLWLKVAERSLLDGWRPKNRELRGTAVALKQQMLQFLRQFQFFAAHFVIEPQWGKMVGLMSQAQGVQTIYRAVQQFATELFDGLMLSSATHFRNLAAILQATREFAGLGEAVMNGRVAPSVLENSLTRLQAQFHKHLRELANPAARDYSKLIRLFTWMDFSRFYERTGIYRVVHSMSAESELASAVAGGGGGGGGTAASGQHHHRAHPHQPQQHAAQRGAAASDDDYDDVDDEMGRGDGAR